MSIFPHIIHLTEVVRQNEVDFVDFLGRLAEGTCTAEDEKFVSENFSREGVPVIYQSHQVLFKRCFEQT